MSSNPDYATAKRVKLVGKPYYYTLSLFNYSDTRKANQKYLRAHVWGRERIAMVYVSDQQLEMMFNPDWKM